MLRARACGLSDVGVIRSHNEDCFEIDPEHQMFVVADGMGGHSHGEIASRIAVEAIREFIAKSTDEDATLPFELDASVGRHANVLRAAIRLAHDRVLKAIRLDTTLHGMGTTVVGLLLDGDVAAVAHVGDSRAYRLRGGKLELLTQDHTWVNEQVVAGFLSEEQARVHPLKNVVTRALGGDAEVEVDVREWKVARGRPLPALLGRPDHHAQRPRDPRPAARSGPPRGGLRPPGAGRQPARRLRQRLGRAAPPRARHGR